MNIENAALMAYLKASHAFYHGKALELREVIEGWLSYVPNSFPHYTRHTVRHSDEIIIQMSSLLFGDDDPITPTISLSAVEVYILIAAAYLHDAGMVASDREKAEILKSDEWRFWALEGGGAARWRELEAFRYGVQPANEDIRNFLADVQLRFLISEFIRRTHHIRSAEVITQYQAQLARCAFDDPLLQRTISDICVAHGLRGYELDDRERFPHQRDIRGEKVNVRLLAILLRLGDLLDMSSDRACPLLLNAACPLPAESLAHWTQYQRITHRNTSPARIEITAECYNGEEHRVLQDWCQWIVDETRNASILMAHSPRHADWKAPEVTISGDSATIIVRPHQDAKYIPSRWIFTVDQDAILTRLIDDVYDTPAIFIRELTQNALDTTRCQMYVDLAREGFEAPEFPTQIQVVRRNLYPIRLSLRENEWVNPLSGETEKRQVFSIEDCGIGMDTEIIQKYLLQVGRSFYTTDEFRRSFRFIPSSRFGIGFLSVFGVSDDVVIETYKPSSRNQDGPIKLTLKGPRSYLLTEKGARTRNGTQVSVVLSTPWGSGQLTRLCSKWFRQVEVPVIIDDLGVGSTIVGEQADQFVKVAPDLTDPSAAFEVKGFPINKHGIEGAIYVFARRDSTGERWDQRYWAENGYLNQAPGASIPSLPDNLICVNGIAVQNYLWHRDAGLIRVTHPFISVRADYRGLNINFTLSRNRARSPIGDVNRHSEIESRCEEIISDHLRTSAYGRSKDSWKYKQRLMDEIEVGLETFWHSLPEAVHVYVSGIDRLVSMKEIWALNEIRTISFYPQARAHSQDKGKLENALDSVAEKDRRVWTEKLTITEQDIPYLSERHQKALFESRVPKSVRMLNAEFLAIDWVQSSERPAISVSMDYSTYVIPLLSKEKIGANVIRGSSHSCVSKLLLNSENEFVAWLFRVKDAVDKNMHGLSSKQFDRILELLSKPLKYGGSDLEDLSRYLEAWRELPNLPEELCVPEFNLTRDQFQILQGDCDTYIHPIGPSKLARYRFKDGG